MCQFLKNNPLKLSKILPFFIIFTIFLTSACSVPKFMKPSKVDTNKVPVDSKERARQNINEGRGVSLKNVIGGREKSTTFDFGTSNPLWRASLEIIDFMPLTTVDYSGGIIITDWYSDSKNKNESIKITIRFLANEVRTNSLKVIVHSKNCNVNENCQINEIDSKIKFELQKSILKKASLLEIETQKKTK
jgi:hypothetical protein